MAKDRVRLAVLVGLKGRGSNMLAIAKACQAPDYPAEIAAVVGQSDSAPAIESAKLAALDTLIIPSREEGYGLRLKNSLLERQISLICLAGYMRLLPSEVVEGWPNRILNIHPALLPKFGGQGMFGMKVHEAVLAAGEIESGCTVHFVNEKYDDGRIILQRKCLVCPGDTPESLAARVLEQEHLAYPDAIAKLCSQIA